MSNTHLGRLRVAGESFDIIRDETTGALGLGHRDGSPLSARATVQVISDSVGVEGEDSGVAVSGTVYVTITIEVSGP